MTRRMVMLVAGMGTRLKPLTLDRPKCMVPLHGRPLLDWQMDAARLAGVDEFVLVGGYRADRLPPGARTVINPDFETTNMVESLWCAREHLDEDAVVSYGDIVCSPTVIAAAAQAAHDISVVVDTAWRPYWERRFADPLRDAESLRMDADLRIRSIGQKPESLDSIQAQFIGLIGLRRRGWTALLDWYERRKRADPAARRMFMTDLLQAAIVDGVPVHGAPSAGGWLEVDSHSDLKLAEELTRPAGRSLEIGR